MNLSDIRNIFLVVAVSFLSACNEWLEPESEVDPDRQLLLESPEGIEDALTGIYASMSHKDLYGRALTYYIPSILAGHYGMVGTDIDHWLTYSYAGKYGNVDEFAIIDIDRIWSKIYNLIANANSIIEYVDSAEGCADDEFLRVAKGEALALRGFLHFELLRYFAPPYAMAAEGRGIPYMDKMNAVAGEFLDSKAVLARITEDLRQSLLLTCGVPESGPLRFNRTATLATLARVYLYCGENSLAYEYAVKAIDERPEYVTWHDCVAENQDRLLESELIFALNVSRLDEYAAGWVLPGGIGRKSTIMVITQAGEYYFDEPGDIREKLWVTSIGFDRYCNKFDLASSMPIMPMIRLSEMAYIAAESAPTESEGIAYLNLVRIHRGLPRVADGCSVCLHDEIQKEYQREFICEGQLWHFYKRNMVAAIPGNSNFRGRLDLYTFPLPEDELIFGNGSL